MKINFMRNLDGQLGGVLVSLIRFFSFFIRSRRPSPSDLGEVKDILFIKFFGGGSIILASPMIRGLKKLYNNPTIHVLTFHENRHLCSRVSVFDQILTVRKGSLYEFAFDTVKTLVKLWKIRPSIVVDGEFFSNFTALIAWLTPAKVRVGFHERQVSRGDIMTCQVPLNVHKHITTVFYSLAVALGARYEDAHLDQLSLLPPEPEDVGSAFAKLNLEPKSPIVVVNPNAGPLSTLRRWPADYFVELVSLMAQDHPEITFVFVGSVEEASYVANIHEQIPLPNVVSSAGKLTIAELCGLIWSSMFLVTNDSMAVHIASAYHKHIVCFFGPETPRFYGPLHDNSLTFFEDIPCSPCLSTFDNKVGWNCQDNVCLKQITPKRVMDAIDQWYFSKKAERIT